MPNINDAFPSKYLKAADLQGNEPVVTIDRVDMEPVGQKKELKPVLYFKGKDKGLVLNKTNANKIIELLQSAVTEEWDGHRIRLYATETQFGGELVECIRIKAPATTKPKAKPKPQPIVTDDEPDDELPVEEVPF